MARQECTATLDTGESKVCALATFLDKEGVLIITTGSGGGKICEYKDITGEVEDEKQADQDIFFVRLVFFNK